ncbi:hypothetical protein [Cupriavidus basilensis]|uniref:hypothetical protein n=1 Tax=Cupriavidus basilensis TaxID=68895 RepID=UPI0039F69CCF
MPKSRDLFEQMTPTGLRCLALCIGFDYSDDAACAGFRNALRDMAPLPDDFTIGDAVDAYIAHLVAMRSAVRASSTTESL